MKCRNAKKLVFKFIDGLDDDTQKLELENHLAECTACETLASWLNRSMDLLHRAPQEKTSDNFAWNLRIRLNQERNMVRENNQSYRTMFRSWNLRYAATAVSAFAVVLVAGLLAVNSDIVPTVQSWQNVSDNSVATSSPNGPLADDKPNLNSVQPSPFRSASQGSNPYNGPGAPESQVLDAPSYMTPAEVDSLLGVEMQGLTPQQRIRYMNILSSYFKQRYQTEALKLRNR